MNFKYELKKLSELGSPIRFEYEDKLFVLEVQSFNLSIEKQETISDERMLVFAVDTDGFDLILDLESKDGEIFKCEHGEIESLGISLMETINAQSIKL